MLEAMKLLALDFLWNHEGSGEPPDDLEIWFKNLRESNPEKLFQYLVESSEKMEHYYTLSPDKEDPDLAVLGVSDFKATDRIKLPFIRQAGGSKPAVGPVITRTYNNNTIGPRKSTQKTTLDSFGAISEAGEPWSPLFRAALDTWTRQKLSVMGREPLEAASSENAYSMAIEQIPEKKSVFLAFQDKDGRLPGESPEYVQYLQTILAEKKYATKDAPPFQNNHCSLCGLEPVAVFCNAVTGGGLNIGNMDRHGAFPGITIENAVLGYPLCADCADLIYVYKNEVAKLFRASIAGDQALIIPRTGVSGKTRQLFFKQVADLTTSPPAGSGKQSSLKAGIETREERLMRLLGDERVVTSLDIIWIDPKKKYKLKGAITDILPSRLRRISETNDRFRDTRSPLFPEHPLADFDLSLAFLLDLLKRPGGKKARSINESRRMFQLRRDLASAIYHGESLSPVRFGDEVFLTARYYLNEAISNKDGWKGILYEFKKKQTMAGWVRHLARFIHYLTTLEVFPMPNAIYQPQSDLLRPYFGPESGIDTDQKAFAFILGILYGKVMQVQGAKGFNVGANALTWLRRLTLTGKDLPELYCKVRGKLLAYETERSGDVRKVLEELGDLGTRIGDNFDLPQVATCYFLLLGQSVTVRVLPGSGKEDKPDTTQS